MITYIIIFITAVTSIACFGNRERFYSLSLNPYRITHDRQWYRVITHGFVHGDYTHLIVNMLVLFSFGRNIEELFKSYHQAAMIGNDTLCYLLLYFGGMIVASAGDIIKRREDPYYNSVGASGAVSAVIFASIFFNPWSKIYLFAAIPIPGIVFGILYLVYEQYMSRRGGTNINHSAHIYGAIYGLLLPILLNPSFFDGFLKNFGI